MNVLRWGSNMIENTTPAGFIIAGAVLAMASPPVRKGLRSAAVMATRGVLMAAGTVQSAMTSMRENVEDFIAEAKEPLDTAPTDAGQVRGGMIRSARRRGRRLAVGAAAGAFAVRNELRSIVEDARQHRNSLRDGYETADSGSGQEVAEAARNQLREADGLGASTTETGPDSPGKRRSRSKQS